MKSKFSFKKRIKSFTYAFQGFKPVFLYEHNVYIHILAAVVVIVAGFYFELTKLEWIAIVFSIGLVFICEFLNSAIETLADVVSPEKNKGIKKVKDIAAAAVLIAAITAVIIALIIFIPRFF